MPSPAVVGRVIERLTLRALCSFLSLLGHFRDLTGQTVTHTLGRCGPNRYTSLLIVWLSKPEIVGRARGIGL